MSDPLRDPPCAPLPDAQPDPLHSGGLSRGGTTTLVSAALLQPITITVNVPLQSFRDCTLPGDPANCWRPGVPDQIFSGEEDITKRCYRLEAYPGFFVAYCYVMREGLYFFNNGSMLPDKEVIVGDIRVKFAETCTR